MSKRITPHMRLRQWMSWVIICSFCLLMASGAVAQKSAENPKNSATSVTCALIAGQEFGFNESATFQLLETALSQEPALALLERAEASRIFDEKKIQLALGAEGGAARRELGTLLKARLLVILKAGEKVVGKDKAVVRFLDVTLAETDSGLRLGQRRLVWQEDHPQEVVAQISQCVREARVRLASKVRRIVAVPPFLCEDFRNDYAPMKEAFAEIIRQGLIRTPGIIQVELAEAHAIGRELALVGAEKITRPSLPYYILGRYGNQGSGRQRTVSVSLELKQGDKVLGRESRAKMASAEVARFLADTASSFQQAITHGRLPTGDPKLEVGQLLGRAGEFRQLGEWTEALSLYEAGLLLKPDELETQRQAAMMCAYLSREAYDGGYEAYRNAKAFPPDKEDESLDYNLRGLDHLEQYFRLGESDPALKRDEVRELIPTLWVYYFPHQGLTPEQKAALIQVGRGRREILASFLERMAKNGRLYEIVRTIPEQVTTSPFMYATGPYAPTGASVEQAHEFYLRLMRILIKLPTEGMFLLDAAMMESSIWGSTNNSHYDHWANYDKFLEGVSKLPDKRIPFVVAYCRLRREWRNLEERHNGQLDANSARVILKKLEELIAQMQRLKIDKQDWYFYECFDKEAAELRMKIAHEPGKAPTAGGEEIRFEPISDLDPTIRIVGWIPCGPGVDLTWNEKEIYLMRKKGKLEKLYHSGKVDFTITNAVYDGRYAWAAVVRPEPLLLVIDSQAGTLAHFASADGLPPSSKEARVTALAPGEAFAVGSFGRVWCARLKYEADGRKTVDLMHEAKVSSNDPKDPAANFKPTFLETIHTPAGEKPFQVLVGRHFGESEMDEFPLLINLKDRSVKAIANKYIWSWNGLTEQGKEFYAVDNLSNMMWRMSWPDYGREHLIFNLTRDEIGPVVFINGECYVIGCYPWKADLVHRKKTALRGTPPDSFIPRRYVNSNLYGSVILGDGDPPRSVCQYHFEIKKP